MADEGGALGGTEAVRVSTGERRAICERCQERTRPGAPRLMDRPPWPHRDCWVCGERTRSGLIMTTPEAASDEVPGKPPS